MSDPGAIIHWPFGPADKQAAKAYSATIAATIKNDKTIVPIEQLTGAATLNLTVSDRINIGATLVILTSVDGTNRTLTPGTKMTGTAQTLTASKNYRLEYEWDGTTFNHVVTTLLN